MKRITILSVALFFTIILSSAAFSETTTKIGTINLKLVEEKHPIAIKWYEDLKVKIDKRREEFKQSILTKYNVKDMSLLTDPQKAEAQKLFDAENKKFEDEMTPLLYEKQKVMEDDIIQTATQVAKDKKLDFILDRVVVIFGGTDITDDILARINKKYEEKK